jgi:hypothetical protein
MSLAIAKDPEVARRPPNMANGVPPMVRRSSHAIHRARPDRLAKTAGRERLQCGTEPSSRNQPVMVCGRPGNLDSLSSRSSTPIPGRYGMTTYRRWVERRVRVVYDLGVHRGNVG